MTPDYLKREDWWVYPLIEVEARRLIVDFHYSRQYNAPGSYFHGLYRRGEHPLGRAYGACVWLAQVPLSRRFGRMPLVLARLVLDENAPKNAASYMLRRSMALIDRDRWPILVTYADEGQGHQGGIYVAAGWTPDGDGGGVTYRNPTTGEMRSSLGRGSHFLPCPDGWDVVQTVKHRFVHAVAASSDASALQVEEGGSQPTLPLHFSDDRPAA